MDCHFLLQGICLPDPEIEPASLVSPALAGRNFELTDSAYVQKFPIRWRFSELLILHLPSQKILCPAWFSRAVGSSHLAPGFYKNWPQSRGSLVKLELRKAAEGSEPGGGKWAPGSWPQQCPWAVRGHRWRILYLVVQKCKKSLFRSFPPFYPLTPPSFPSTFIFRPVCGLSSLATCVLACLECYLVLSVEKTQGLLRWSSGRDRALSV